MERSTPRIVARNRFDGALFDLDGVLTDSAALHAADRVALSGGEAVRQPARGVVDEDVHGAELGLGVVEEAPGSPRVEDPARPAVLRARERGDLGQDEVPKGLPEGGAHQLGGEAAAPVLGGEEVGHLGAPVRRFGVPEETSPADHTALAAEDRRSGCEAVLGEAGGVGLEEAGGRVPAA